MTQEKLAESTGLTTTHIGHIETGRRWPSPDVLETIAKGLGVASSALFTGDIVRISPTPAEALEVLAQAIGTKAPEIPKPVREATLLDDPWLKEVARIPKHLRYHLAPGMAAAQDVMKESDRNENDQGKKPQG